MISHLQVYLSISLTEKLSDFCPYSYVDHLETLLIWCCPQGRKYRCDYGGSSSVAVGRPCIKDYKTKSLAQNL